MRTRTKETLKNIFISLFFKSSTRNQLKKDHYYFDFKKNKKKEKFNEIFHHNAKCKKERKRERERKKNQSLSRIPPCNTRVSVNFVYFHFEKN